MNTNPGRLHRSLWVEKVRILWNRELTKTTGFNPVSTERFRFPSRDLRETVFITACQRTEKQHISSVRGRFLAGWEKASLHIVM